MVSINEIPHEILNAVRDSLGDNPQDTSNDAKIERMSPEELIAEWSQFIIGDYHWGIVAVEAYKEMCDCDCRKQKYKYRG
jgi:hypothetical protein